MVRRGVAVIRDAERLQYVGRIAHVGRRQIIRDNDMVDKAGRRVEGRATLVFEGQRQRAVVGRIRHKRLVRRLFTRCDRTIQFIVVVAQNDQISRWVIGIESGFQVDDILRPTVVIGRSATRLGVNSHHVHALGYTVDRCIGYEQERQPSRRPVVGRRIVVVAIEQRLGFFQHRRYRGFIVDHTYFLRQAAWPEYRWRITSWRLIAIILEVVREAVRTAIAVTAGYCGYGCGKAVDIADFLYGNDIGFELAQHCNGVTLLQVLVGGTHVVIVQVAIGADDRSGIGAEKLHAPGRNVKSLIGTQCAGRAYRTGQILRGRSARHIGQNTGLQLQTIGTGGGSARHKPVGNTGYANRIGWLAGTGQGRIGADAQGARLATGRNRIVRTAYKRRRYGRDGGIGDRYQLPLVVGQLIGRDSNRCRYHVAGARYNGERRSGRRGNLGEAVENADRAPGLHQIADLHQRA